MIGRNRHNKYRRAVYKRHNVSTIIISSAITLTVCIIAMLIFGNVLHAKYQKDNISDDDQSTDAESQSGTNVYVPPNSINAYSVLIETNDSSTFSTRLESLPDSEKSAVSIPLNTQDGSLLYSSEVAKNLGFSTNGFSVTLSSVVNTAKEKNVYLSGVYYVNDFSINDAILRQVALSKSSAIISEALTSGLNEVIIVLQQATSDNVEEVARLVESIKRNSPNGIVGLTVPKALLDIEDEVLRSEKILQLSQSADLLAINASVLGTDASPEQTAQFLGSHKFFIHKYKMRVLLPKAINSENQTALIEATENASLNNWQILEY